MKALLCSNCGSGKFKELTGKKRQCVFCGAEFEVDSSDVEENLNDDVIYCPDPDKFNSFIEIARVSKPGIPARDWRTMSCQIDNLKVAVGSAFLPLYRCFTEMLVVKVP